MICNEGSPVRIHSDLGGEFINEILNEICKLLDIQHTTTLGYDPSNNGAVERSNRTFIELIKHRDIHDIKAWDSILPYLTHSYNVTPHSTTQFSPFHLFRCRVPLKPDCPAILDNSFPIYSIDSESYLQEFKEEYNRIIAAGKFNSDIAKESMKYFHDLKADVSSKLLRIGDLVMIKATVVKNKLQNRSYGPYKIIAINNTSITLVKATGRDQQTTTTVPMERVIRIPEMSRETAIYHPHYPQTQKSLNAINAQIKFNCNSIKLFNLAEMDTTGNTFSTPGSHQTSGTSFNSCPNEDSMITVQSPTADQVPTPWELTKKIGEQRKMLTRSQSSKY